jgi:hypothetical protein
MAANPDSTTPAPAPHRTATIPPCCEYCGWTIYVVVFSAQDAYRPTPILCAPRGSPHANDARRLTVEQVFQTRIAAMEYGFAAAREWIDKSAAP